MKQIEEETLKEETPLEGFIKFIEESKDFKYDLADNKEVTLRKKEAVERFFKRMFNN